MRRRDEKYIVNIRKRLVKQLVSEGLSLRDIQMVFRYSAVGSIQHLLKDEENS